MALRLGDILREAGFTEVEKGFPKYAVGWYEEEKLWKTIEPFHSRSWNLAKHRPFMVVHTDPQYVYFILFSKSSYMFRCRRDKEYGIEDNTPEVDFQKCDLRDELPCSKLEEKGKLFKRIFDGDCWIVLRINRIFLQEGSVVCGVCSGEAIPQVVEGIIQRELERWKRID